MDGNGYRWEWRSHRGWIPFGDQPNQTIERGYRANRTTTTLKIRGERYEIFFQEKFQRNCKTRKQREIRREKEKKKIDGIVWEYRNDQGSWCQFHSYCQTSVEEAFRRSFANPRSSKGPNLTLFFPGFPSSLSYRL